MFKKNKYYAIFFIKREGSYSRKKKKRFNPTNNKIRYKKGTYPLDVSRPTIIRGLKMFYYIEVDKTQLFFSTDKTTVINPKVIDLIMSQKIVSELTQNLSGSKIALNIMTLIFGGVMGALIGYIIAGMV